MKGIQFICTLVGNRRGALINCIRTVKIKEAHRCDCRQIDVVNAFFLHFLLRIQNLSRPSLYIRCKGKMLNQKPQSKKEKKNKIPAAQQKFKRTKWNIYRVYLPPVDGGHACTICKLGMRSIRIRTIPHRMQAQHTEHVDCASRTLGCMSHGKGVSLGLSVEFHNVLVSTCSPRQLTVWIQRRVIGLGLHGCRESCRVWLVSLE